MSLTNFFWTILYSDLSVTDIKKAHLPSLSHQVSTSLASPQHSTGAEEKSVHICFFVSREFKVEKSIVPQYKAASVFLKILNWGKQTKTFRGKGMNQEGGGVYSPSSKTLNKLLDFRSLYEEADISDNLCFFPSIISNNC